MTDKSPGYRIILGGEPLPGHEREQVVDALAELFHSTPERMQHLLAGREVALKKVYTHDQAVRIQRRISEAGAECRLEQAVAQADPPAADEPDHAAPRDEPAIESHAEPHTEADADAGPDEADEADEPEGERMQRLLDDYVQSNTDYYRRQFARFGPPDAARFAPSWHWPAFFFFFPWALYRKLWTWAGVYLAAAVFAALALPPGGVYMTWALGWTVAWTLCANYLYFRRASAETFRAMQGPLPEQELAAVGGVSRMAVVAGLAVMALLSSQVSEYFTGRFMDRYGDDLGEVLPGSGSQFRGDGSAMGETIDDKTRLGVTSLQLSYLGTSLKILLVRNKGDAGRDAIVRFEQRFSGGEVNDSWGTPIMLKKELSRYVLASAGPDRLAGTDDDVLQPVYFD